MKQVLHPLLDSNSFLPFSFFSEQQNRTANPTFIEVTNTTSHGGSATLFGVPSLDSSIGVSEICRSLEQYLQFRTTIATFNFLILSPIKIVCLQIRTSREWWISGVD
ncbi:uncharacterized protein LOC130817276 [Amaranthus tricolor]|uniref:uncharacterized protein LOC130817276 n=1 Tax=Amaranthus tricolor TaxID=29722 RepID=UPI0025877F39|nr:uncharacterized protein LOC130817276 [Amaranthus tricolor]